MLVVTGTDAVKLFNEGKFFDALPLYEGLLAADPHNAFIQHSLGYIHNQIGNYQKSIDLISSAISIRPSVKAFHINLAEAYRNSGHYERSINCCRVALNVWPESPDALLTMGLAHHNRGDQAAACESFRQAIRLKPDSAVAYNNLGLALQTSGHTGEALDCFRKALDLSPDLNRARVNLGLLLIEVERYEDALPYLLEAAYRQPEKAVLRVNIGNAYKGLNRMPEARICYFDALQIDPTLPMPHLLVGQTLVGDQPREALPWFKSACSLDADQAFLWEQLAGVYGELEEPAEAIPCWERAIAVSKTDRPGPHISLGWALQDDGRVAEAMHHFSIALILQPDSPHAHLALASGHEELGEMDKAEYLIREAIRLQPLHGQSHARLATLLRDKLDAEDLSALEQRLTDATIVDQPKARLLFGLAHVLDARGQADRVAECLAEANSIILRTSKGNKNYNPDEHQLHVDSIIKAFDSQLIHDADLVGDRTDRPIFVFGFPRSGTTLTEQILASHLSIFGAGERRFARQSFDSIPDAMDSNGSLVDAVAKLDGTVLANIAIRHLAKLDLLDAGAALRIVDKMPDNYIYLGLLYKLFPNALFIHCRRDLRDIAVSCWMTDFRSIRWANDQKHLGRRLCDYRRLMNHWHETLPPGVIHEVNYEDTVADVERVARRLVAASGLPWDPSCLEFYRTRRSVKTASVMQVRQPIYTKSLARWRKYDHLWGELFASLPVDPGPDASGV